MLEQILIELYKEYWDRFELLKVWVSQYWREWQDIYWTYFDCKILSKHFFIWFDNNRISIMQQDELSWLSFNTVEEFMHTIINL